MRKALKEKADKVLCLTYRRQPVLLVRGKGIKVWDNQGRKYLDFVAGISAVNLGHSHPEVIKAICQQAKKLVHISNLFYNQHQILLAELLVEKSVLDRAFFCNSGAEANESAIKLARKYSQEKGNGGYKIICAKNSFHGRTFGSLSATGQEKFKKGFKPMLSGFKFVKYGDLKALKESITEDTIAVMLEPVQGEAGVIIPPEGYLAGVRKICDRHKLLLILDEVQTAMGRIGRLFGYEWAGVEPDIITLAKALGNGFPIGAMLAKEKIAEVFGPGSHASTFGGNPLACSAGLATVRVISKEKLYLSAQKSGGFFLEGLKELKKRHPCIKEVRGVGLMLAVELRIDSCERVVEGMRKRGFLINLTQGKVLRFLPPLIVKKNEIERLIEALDQELARFDLEV